MIQLFIPFLIGIALGLPAPQGGPDLAAADPVAPIVREPEPQVPTGNFTTAIEVKPILSMTKQNWVAVRLYEGNDLVYFTHLLAWRCGLWEIRYSINSDETLQSFPMEPCHEETAQPNAMTNVVNFLPYITLPPESVETIYVELVFDDGTTDFAVFTRPNVLMP